MILFPPIRNIAALSALAGSLALAPAALAQDFTRQLAGADRFFEDGILPADLAALLDPTMDGALKGVVGYNLSAGITYNSNIELSSVNEEDDLYFNIDPSVFYSTDPEGGARHVLTAFYGPSVRISTGDSSRNRINHSGGASYRFNGARTSFTAFLNLAQASGSDRFTNSYSEGTIFSYGVRADYQLAPRTSVYGNVSSSTSTYETSGQRGGDFVAAGLGAYWAATERLSMGPSVRYNWSDSSNTGSRTALGLLFNARYLATDLVSLNASIGVESVKDSRSGDRDPQMTGSLSFNYQISPIWNWSGSVSYANVPSPDTFGYGINDLSLSTSLSRRLDVGAVSLFASYSNSDYQATGSIPLPGGGSSDVSEIGVSYGRPFFSERISFGSSISYRSSSGRNEWSQWICSLSWGTSF